jgi:formylglycine-generating enzyme required for sulfatase activity
MQRLMWLLVVSVLVLTVVCTSNLVTGCKAEQSGTEPGNVIVNSIGMKLAYIPAGEFEMGSPLEEQGRQEDEFRHQVKLTQPFCIGVTEVTQSQWEAVMGYNRSHFKGGELPVEKLSWREAVSFCEKLSEKEGKVYRLPTEAEWEYASRAGSAGAFGGGGNIDEMGWYEANSEQHSHPVGTKQANAWGLYDMHGNVSEWCSDIYSADYPDGAVVDPVGLSEGTYRLMRGGSWSSFVRGCRCAARNSAPVSYQFKQTGFRVVMEVSE